MNIRDALLEDKIQNRNKAISIAEYVCSSPKHFKELMKCFLTSEYRLAQRAAWSISWAARKNPELIMPYMKELVAQLNKTDVHDAVIRNSIRVLEEIEIPEELHGVVMNACFNFIENPSTPVAIKAFSLTTLFNLSKYYPETKNELKLIIEERWDNETPAFKSRGKKILQQLDK
jgi:hypothetical protein